MVFNYFRFPCGQPFSVLAQSCLISSQTPVRGLFPIGAVLSIMLSDLTFPQKEWSFFWSLCSFIHWREYFQNCVKWVWHGCKTMHGFQNHFHKMNISAFHFSMSSWNTLHAGLCREEFSGTEKEWHWTRSWLVVPCMFGEDTDILISRDAANFTS